MTARAKDILAELNKGESAYRAGVLDGERAAALDNQVSFYSEMLEQAKERMLDSNEQAALESLKDLEIDSMTPLEAMNALNDLKHQLQE